MKNVARLLGVILGALALVVCSILLFHYTGSAHTEVSVETASSLISFQDQANGGATTLLQQPDGKPTLTDGTPVTNVVFAAQQIPVTTEDRSFAPPESRQIAATANGGKPALLQGKRVENVVYAATKNTSMTAQAGSGITLWYGLAQPFGQNGKPQNQINILGTIMAPIENISATYRLNDGAIQPLSLGPDNRRLAQSGDFNAEINYSELITGLNYLVITATDHISATTVQTVEVNYTPGNVWPLPYSTNWQTAAKIADRAQVVDGQWALASGTVKPTVFDYDRLIAVGDTTWTDYEVTVPVTIHSIDAGGFQHPSNGPGVGLLLRWQGHFQQESEQPSTGWQNFGALGWYRWGKDSTGATIAAQEMLGYEGRDIASNTNKLPSFGVQYFLKMSVQSVPGKASYYRFKSWRTSEVEPKSWDMEGYGRIGEPTNGSLMLVAHHVDATFGDVTVRPLSAITPRIDVDTDGNGAVILSPDKEEYAYGEEVELLATGNSGFAFDAWSGDVSSTQNSLKLFVTQDISLTANFIMPSPSTLQTSTPGGGQIKISPQKASYAFDELVSITAIPNAGQQFLGWSGSTTSLQNPLTFKIRSNTNLIATFGPAAPPISDDFNSCRLDPDLWTVRDPKADSTLELNGTQLLISVPANSDHNLFEEKNFAPRILQELPDQDFIVEAKFDSLPSLRYQTQGIVIEEDVDNFVRMEYYHNGTNVIMYAAASVDAQVTAYASRAITVPVGTTSLYMRVTRTDDSWTQERSFDGVLWETNITFDHALTVNRGGVYGGNADPKTDAEDTSPAYTAIIDYFFNTASRIEPEDGNAIKPTATIIGQGTVVFNPDKPSYSCDEQIQLSAVPDDNWEFGGWSGAVSGDTTPITMTLRQGHTITATFTGDPQSQIYLPLVLR